MTDSPSARTALRVMWGILGIPVGVVLFAVLITAMFPIGGGTAHLMFAYSPGGSLSGARTVFAGYLIATAVVTWFLLRTRYPLPWWGTAGLMSLLIMWAWSRPVLSRAAGEAFERQGLLLMPLVPAVAFAVAALFERRRRARGGAPSPSASNLPEP